MIKIFVSLFSMIALLFLGHFAWRGYSGEFAAVHQPQADCPASFFAQRARVFDAVTICATAHVSPVKLRHAAAIAAQWLDNDGDGLVDEPRLLPLLREKGALLVMSEAGFPLVASLRIMMGHSGVTQDLGAQETAPHDGERDAAPEEIHHLIYNAGWVELFPDLFADRPGSTLYRIWEQAEQRGHYDYDDPTCNAACKVSEFFYLATAAYLGSEADLQSNEMRLKTRQDLTEALPDIVALMQSERYHYPTRAWPDGDYTHAHNIVLDGPVDFLVLDALEGYKIAFAAPGEEENQDIWIMDPDGGGRVNLTGGDGPGQDIYPEWAPDGRFIYYTSNKHGNDTLELYRVNTQGAPEPERISDFGREVRSLSVSPENRHIALGLMTASVPLGADLKPYSADLYVLPMTVVETRLAAGQWVTRDDLRLIASEPTEAHIWHEQPDWRPGARDDDSVILYARTQNYDDDRIMVDEVWQIRMDGSDNRRVMGGDSMPRWTVDGTEFVTHGFQRVNWATRDVHMMPIDGLSGDAGAASLSPDTALVLFESEDRKRRPGLAMAGGNRTGFVTLSDAPAYEPRWSPVRVENGN